MTWNNLDTTTLTVMGILTVLAVLALVAWAMQHRKQSQRLQHRFGSEYGRTMDYLSSRDKAEAELIAREQRVASHRNQANSSLG